MLEVDLVDSGFPATLAMVAHFCPRATTRYVYSGSGLNTLSGLSFIYLGGAMGINIWLMKGFLTRCHEIDESAMVDGATHWQIFWMFVVPLVRPVVIVVGLLTFIASTVTSFWRGFC